MIKDQIDQLFSKEMSRKEFLQHVGSGMLILFGISGLLNALTQTKPASHRREGLGYGSSAYGGQKR